MTDAVWLILDSLSYSVTPFDRDGENTMPKFERLANEEGVVYSDAYVPGVYSAPSHGSFFTGYLPSETGMHGLNPHFPGNHPTIAEGLADSHESFIITDNPFVHNGLSATFDNNHRIPVSNWEIFDTEAASVTSFLENSEDETATSYADFVLDGGKPIRSLANGVSFKIRNWLANHGSDPSKASLGSWGSYISNQVRSYVCDHDHDVLAVANYMDPHPPFDPSEDALDRFVPDIPWSELPVNIKGSELQKYDIKKRLGLLRAAVWDLDRHLGPLIETLLAEDAFIVITADHGHGFYRSRRFEKERIHVPLVIFSPEEPAKTIDHTVNIRNLPATTAEGVGKGTSLFSGESLLDIETDQISITESINSETGSSNHVEIGRDGSEGFVYDLAGISGDCWVEYVDGNFEVRQAMEPRTAKVRVRINKLLNREIAHVGSERPEYDAETMQRLKDFGYL